MSPNTAGQGHNGRRPQSGGAQSDLAEAQSKLDVMQSDLAIAQSLLDVFSELTGVGCSLTDAQGQTHALSGLPALCSTFHRGHPETLKRCLESDAGTRPGLGPGETSENTCWCGLRHMTAPVYLGDSFCGWAHLGQFLYDDDSLDEKAFSAWAKEYGFDRDTYLAAVQQVPRLSREQARLHMRRLIDIGEVTFRLNSAAQEKDRPQPSGSELRDRLPVGYQSLDKNGCFLYVNQAWLDLLGYTREEVLGRWFGDFIAPHQVDVFRKRFPRFLAARQISTEFEMRRKDGETISVAITGRTSHSEDGNFEATHCVLTDITAQRRAEELRRMTYFAVDAAPDYLHWISPDGRVVYVNDATCRRLGYSRDEMLSMHVWDFTEGIRPEDRLANWHAIKEHRLLTLEQRWRTKSGEVFPVEIHTRYFQYRGHEYNFGSARDVTERKRVEDALRDSEERYRRLFEMESDAIVLVDNETGQILDVNQAAVALYGYSREEWLSMNHTDVSAEPDRTREAALTGMTDIPLRWHRKKDGTVFPTDITASHINWKGRSVHIAAIRDITQRVQTEMDLRQRDEQLRQSQKMEAVGLLAGGIAHDFNNLLTAILGYADLVLSDPALAGSNTLEDVREIRTAAERASALTRQILAYSRRQPLQPTLASLNDIVTGMEPLLRRTLGENISVETALCPELWQTEVDLHQFEQVIMNLALNARDAMPSGGTLILETSNTHLDDHYCFTHPHAEPGDYVALRVSDTGMGMDAKTLMHIFEPFFTTKGPGEGTGLGLSTVYGIVQQSRGVIDVQSQPGAGTTLTVYLPRANRPALDPVPHAPQSAVRGGHETILVVEDEAALRGLAHRVLHGLGYDVLVASEASEALDVVRERRGQIDLLVTDVVLPGGMQGPDLVTNILALHPGLPVLYMSGYPRDTMMESGRLDGGVEFLQKPFTPAVLAEAVRRVLAGAPT